MEIKIIERNENKILDREEIYAIVEHKGEATPRREDIKKKIAAIIGVDENLLVVKKILSLYNQQKSRVWVNVYKNKEAMLKIEPKYILKRNKIIE
ncbi:MAG: hypothetical protein QXR54_00270 [Nanopusillaceae archaeon]